MDILNNLNLCGNQIQNLVLHPSATVPTAKAGAIYFDTSTGVNAVKVYDSSASLWRALLDGRDGCVTNSMISSLATGLQVGGVDVFVASGNDARAHIPTTGAVYDFVTDAFKKNDAMVYMGTFAAQATSGVTLTKSMFTLTGGGNPDNLTTFMSKGYTFKVTGNGYFGTIKVEAGDVIIVGKDSPSTTVSNYDIIQMNLTDYITTFGGATGAITLTGVGSVAATAVVGGVNFSMSNGLLSATVVRDTPTVSWTAGTSAGPKLAVKAMGNTSTAVAIPSASADASGVVTTGTQTFAGDKTFTGSITLSTSLTGLTTDAAATLSIRKQSYTINGQSIEAFHIRPWSAASNGALRPFHIGGTNTPGLFFTGAVAYSGATSANSWGINTLDPKYRLEVNGTFGAGASTFSGNVTIGSSSRILFAHSSSNIDLPYFEIVNVGTAASPVYAIHTNVGFYSDSFVNAGGLGLNGGGGSGGGHHLVTWYEIPEYTAAAEDEDVPSALAVKMLYDICVRTVGAATTDSNPSYMVTGITKNPNGSALGFSRAAIYKDKVSLNGSAKGIVTTESAAVSFFAPTSAGRAGQVLISGGSTTSNGVTTYNPPVWADSVKYLIGVNTTNGNTLPTEPSSGPFFRVCNVYQATGFPSGYGTVLEWSRSQRGGDGAANNLVQLFTGTTGNRLFFRQSWGIGVPPGETDTSVDPPVEYPWQEWSEILTTGSVNGALINSFPISTDSSITPTARWNATTGTNRHKIYTTPYSFSSNDLVTALYDNEGNQVITDMQIVSSGGKFAVRLAFAQTITASYKLVVYGV